MDGCWHELCLELRTRSHHPLPDPALAHDDASPRFRREERESPSWDIDINTAAARGSVGSSCCSASIDLNSPTLLSVILSVEVKSTLPLKLTLNPRKTQAARPQASQRRKRLRRSFTYFTKMHGVSSAVPSYRSSGVTRRRCRRRFTGAKRRECLKESVRTICECRPAISIPLPSYSQTDLVPRENAQE
ncbi:hypothetical protein EDB89DRAFT_309175 [Lactarius sanguifluus]|nr:hypothetical protein EDB89DRAFT_309175 [Lactarius sanguifluus]